MSDLKARRGSRNPDRGTADGAMAYVRGLRDGTLSVADFCLVMAMEGRAYGINLGVSTTPVTFRVGLTVLQPEAVIDVPNGTIIIPTAINVYLETSAGTINEVTASTSTALRGAGTSTAGTILNLSSEQPNSSNCKYYYTYSGNAVALANVVEVFRSGYAFADTTVGPIKSFKWGIGTDGLPPILVGPSSLSLYIAATGTAPTGFAHIQWVELQKEWII